MTAAPTEPTNLVAPNDFPTEQRIQKRRILFTWELGDGLGHVMPLVETALVLKSQGHNVAFALRDVRLCGSMLKEKGFLVFQAPIYPEHFFESGNPQPQTMADILSIFGFTSRPHLSSMLCAWESLFAMYCPDVVVASYAPLSQLYARRLGIPTVLMALPFELPAAAHPSPCFLTGKYPDSTSIDDCVIRTVNEVLDTTGIHSVFDIFRANKVFLMSFPELDYLHPRMSAEGPMDICYTGSFFVDHAGISPQWPKISDALAPNSQYRRKRIFAYLNTGLPDLDALRRAIHESPHDYCVYLRGASEIQKEQWQSSNTCTTNAMVNLKETLSACDAVMSYGGNGFISASLLYGKPTAFYVAHTEAFINAKKAQSLGAGIVLEKQTVDDVINALDEVLNNPSYALAAVDFAKTNPLGYSSRSAKLIADEIIGLTV